MAGDLSHALQVAGDATLTLELAPSNAVTGLTLRPAAPTEGAAGLALPAGSPAALAVAVDTEDGAPLPAAAAAAHLAVRLVPPSGDRAESELLRLDEAGAPQRIDVCDLGVTFITMARQKTQKKKHVCWHCRACCARFVGIKKVEPRVRAPQRWPRARASSSLRAASCARRASTPPRPSGRRAGRRSRARWPSATPRCAAPR
jgi:hypothetical protein